MARSTLSCCLVIRNERDKIFDCLSHINILADEIVIVDTGSTDDTLNVIAAWIKRFNAQSGVKVLSVGSKFHDADGDFDFGSAKTFAFLNATKDYVMWLDASDKVSDQKAAKLTFIKETNIDKNVYFTFPTELSKNFAFIRTRIGPRQSTVMEGRIHEYMRFRGPQLKKIFIPVPIINYKKGRDLPRNLRQLEKEWKINPSARVAFYLGNTHREMYHTDDALYWFRQRIYTYKFKTGFDEEYFKAAESIAEIIVESKKDSGSTQDLFDIAKVLIEKEPKRFEGYYYLAKYYMRKSQYEAAIQELRKYKACTKPSSYKLWLNGALYNGKAVLNAIEECKTAIKYKDVIQPDEILDYGRSNSSYSVGDAQYR